MNLYEINTQIEALIAQMEFDPETGELCASADEILHNIETLQMEKQSVLEYLAKAVLNNRAAQAALKEEEKRLKERRSRLEQKESRLIEVLDRECGQKTDLGVATLNYRNSQKVSVMNYEKGLQWLQEHGCDSCYKVPKTELYKPEIKRLLAAGTEIPGITLEPTRSVSLR